MISQSKYDGVELAEVAEFIRGITFKPSDIVKFGSSGFVVCMRTKNIQKDLDESDLISVPKKFVKNDMKFLQEGDLLISTANSFELVGKVCWVPKLKYPATAGGFISVLRKKSNSLDQRYLYHWVSSGLTQHKLRYCGRQTTNISNMDIGRALKLIIPLPPLEEQKRIAAILDKADQIRRKRQQAIDLSEQFLRSVFLDMFGDPLFWSSSTIPGDWESRKIGDIAMLKRGYDLPVQDRQTGEFNIYAANGIVGSHNKFKVSGPGVITGRSGTIGKVTYSENDFWPLNTSLYVSDFNGNNPRYIEWFLRFFRLERYYRGAGVPTLNRNLFLDEVSFLPPSSLQLSFEKVFDQVQNYLKKSNAFDDSLFNSLSQKAFKGELT